MAPPPVPRACALGHARPARPLVGEQAIAAALAASVDWFGYPTLHQGEQCCCELEALDASEVYRLGGHQYAYSCRNRNHAAALTARSTVCKLRHRCRPESEWWQAERAGGGAGPIWLAPRVIHRPPAGRRVTRAIAKGEIAANPSYSCDRAGTPAAQRSRSVSCL